jgi:hypothetical protein
MYEGLKGLGPVQRAVMAALPRDGHWVQLARILRIVYGTTDPDSEMIWDTYRAGWRTVLRLEKRGLVETKRQGGRVFVRTKVWLQAEAAS